MSFIRELYRTGFLRIRRALCIAAAKKQHGSNACLLLHYAAAYFGDAPALSDGNETISFRELYAKTLQCTASLRRKISAQEKGTVILLTENKLPHIIALYAVQNLGMRLIPVHAKMHETEISKIKERQPSPCFIIAETPVTPDTVLLQDLFSETINDHFISKKNAPVIFATSGTTGAAKMIEKRPGIFYWLRAFTDLLLRTGIHRRDAVYIAAPIAHGFGYTVLLFALALGKKAVVGSGRSRKEQPAIMLQEKTDLLAGVPAALYQLAEYAPQTNPVKLIITGGAPLTQTVLDKISNVFGKNIFSMYGSTEAGTSFIADYNDLQKNIHALGRPLKNVAYRLKPLPHGSFELMIRSPLANQTGDAGWLHTGDLVSEDDNGNIIWCGRKDDMIIKNGVNIYPAEIEKCLLTLSDAEDAMVCGVQHELKGQEIIAYVQLKPDSSLTADEIRTALHHQLSAVKVPDKIIFIEQFERTDTGKKIRPK